LLDAGTSNALLRAIWRPAPFGLTVRTIKKREPMEPFIYNIPAQMVEAFAGRKIIVRSHDPAELAQHLSPTDLGNVLYAQLLSLNVEVEALAHWGESMPLDLTMRNPAEEFPLLYNFSKLQDKHPIRVSIHVKPGFGKAVWLALALNFAVKLEVGQPSPALVEEMAEVLDRYLHRPSVSQPVEYFHSIFLSFYHREPTSLWFIQGEDPEQVRFITDEGVETVSPRFAGVDLKGKAVALNGAREDAPAGEQSECDGCEFLDCCGGYFKWPDRQFSCAGVKTLFGTLKGAAEELRCDLDTYRSSQAGGGAL
jgi:hypothetical protein